MIEPPKLAAPGVMTPAATPASPVATEPAARMAPVHLTPLTPPGVPPTPARPPANFHELNRQQRFAVDFSTLIEQIGPSESRPAALALRMIQARLGG